MEKNAVIVFGIGVGTDVNETRFSAMTTRPKEKTRFILENFDQLLQQAVLNTVHDRFCSSIHAHNVRYISFITFIVIAVTTVN